MAKPWIHAKSSAKKFGGRPEDYLEIHNLMDSSKATVADSRHRALTHTSWFIGVILEKIFGTTIVNSDNKRVSVRDIGEQHVLEDFKGKYIPSAQDYLQEIEMKDWMVDGSGAPPSFAKLVKKVTPNVLLLSRHQQKLIKETNVIQERSRVTQRENQAYTISRI